MDGIVARIKDLRLGRLLILLNHLGTKDEAATIRVVCLQMGNRKLNL